MADIKGQLPPRRCEVCHSSEELLYCGGCRAVSYCSQAHQLDHRTAHKRQCNRIKKVLAALESAETTLRAREGDFIARDNCLTGNVELLEQFHRDDYMTARRHLVEGLLDVATTSDTAERALAHGMDMLRLCRADHYGVRFVLSGAMLRLGKNQECYDFLKFLFTCNPDGCTSDWLDLSVPYLDIKNANVLEPCDVFMRPTIFVQLEQIAAMTLLKIKLLFDLQSLQGVSRAVDGRRLPPELTDLIRRAAVSNLLRDRLDVLADADQTRRIAAVRAQVLQLYEYLDAWNKHFWPALLNPGPHRRTPRVQVCVMGGAEAVQVPVQRSYASWAETPGAVDIIRTLVARH